MALEINNAALAKLETAFNYAQQAAQTERTGNDSVIRINGENFSCSVSHADAPKSGFGLLRFRGKDQQALNNATRALFKQTVLDAFGVKSEDELPRSVKNAMELSNYHNKGRPLTARRVMAVVNAIRTAMPDIVVDAAIGKSLARNKMVRSIDTNKDVPELKVTDKMRSKAIELVANHGGNLKPKALQILANYAIFTLANADGADKADDIVKTLAQKIANLDDFEYGDKRFAPLNDKLTEVYQDKLDYYMKPEHAGEFNDQNVSDHLIKDANRASFEINGKNPKEGITEKEEMKKAVAGKFKQVVPEKFQKPLSLFMCQIMGRVVSELLVDKLMVTSTDELVLGADHKGGELMPFSPKDGTCFSTMLGLVGGGKDLHYRLEVNADTKEATLTFESSYDLLFHIEDIYLDDKNICGGVKYSEQFKFDLSGDELKMTSHMTSQHIEP